MIIEGVDNIFIVPPLIVLALAIFYGIFQFAKTGPKKAAISFARVIFYGGLVLIALFIAFSALYFAGGGH